MDEDIFKSIHQAAEKRNLRERTIQLYCSDASYFLRYTNKPVTDLTLEDADAFLTMKRQEIHAIIETTDNLPPCLDFVVSSSLIKPNPA